MNSFGKIGKFITVAVLAVFLPGSLLNAAPIVWCVAGDDHSALEISIGKDHHAPLTRSGDRHAHTLHSVGPQAALECGGHHGGPCIDRELIGSALNASSPDLGASAIDATPVPCIPGQTALHHAALAGAAAVRPPPAERAVSANLLDLRTIKLRL